MVLNYYEDKHFNIAIFRNQGYGGGYGEDGKDRRSTEPQDSDSDSELDIEGPSSPSDLR